MAHKEIDQQALIEQLRGARTVDFTAHVRAIRARLKAVEDDCKNSNRDLAKAAKAYVESLETELRHALAPLYACAAAAYPEDNVDVAHSFSSLGPDNLLTLYEFQVIVRKV